MRTLEESVVSSRRIFDGRPGELRIARIAHADGRLLTIGNQWLTCMIPLAFDSRPSSEVPMAPVAMTLNASLTTALPPSGTFFPSWSTRLALLLQAAEVTRPSTV